MTVQDEYGNEYELPGPFSSVREIKDANAESGRYFFTPDTMRFFDSKVEGGVFHGRLFVTSEQCHHTNGTSEPRKYTVRIAAAEGEADRPHGDIETAEPGFQAFDTLEDAEEWIADKAPIQPLYAGCTCETPERATCGICGRSWCDRCDPVSVSALCHWCHGRGHSNAPVATGSRNP